MTWHIRTLSRKKFTYLKKKLPFGIAEKHQMNDQKEGSWIHHGFLNMLL